MDEAYLFIWVGVFIDNAQDLIVRPALTEEDLSRRLSATVNDAHAKGLTSIHDAALSPVSLDFFKRYVSLYWVKIFETHRRYTDGPIEDPFL